jgi:hypothetical protein
MEVGVSFSVYDITVPVMLHGLNVKPVHYRVRNALGTAIAKLIDATEGGTNGV